MKKRLAVLVLALGFACAAQAARGVSAPLREQMIFRSIPPVIATTVVTPTGSRSNEIQSRPKPNGGGSPRSDVLTVPL